MSLQDTIKNLNTLKGKEDGDLIKADDWNNLILHVVDIGTELGGLIGKVADIEAFVGHEGEFTASLSERIAALEGHVGQASDTPDTPTLSGRVTSLEAFRSSAEPLLDQYTVTLRTSKVHHLLGERAILTAEVRKPDGSVPANRLWVDFIATWGRLKPVQGFTAREGTGTRSVSVQTDEQGVAKVAVSAEQNAKISVEAEQNITTFFEASLPTEPIAFNTAVIGAKTTDDEHMNLVYGVVTKEYESGKDAVKKLADNYYLDVSAGLLGEFKPQIMWRDYSSIVIAFAKNDSDPTTPDRNRGLSSIQVRFRDWIGPWIDKYFFDDHLLVDKFADRIRHGLDPNLGKAFDDIYSGFDEEIKDYGIVGRHKALDAFGKAADKVDDTVMPGYESKIKETLKNAANTQKALDILQFTTAPTGAPAPGQPAAKAVFDQAKHVAHVDEEVHQIGSKVELEVGQIDGKIGQETSRVVAMRIEELEVPGGKIDVMKKEIGNVRAQVTSLMQIGDVSKVQAKLEKVDDVSRRLDLFMGNIG
jgi:hypothetical protein